MVHQPRPARPRRVGPAALDLLLVVALAGLPAGAFADKVKIAVLPYAPIHDGVPRATGERLADTLSEELSHNEAFEVVKPPAEDGGPAAPAAKKGPSDAQSKAVEGAKADVAKAKEQLKKRKVKPALDGFTKAIAALEKTPEGLLETQVLVDAYVRQAVALFLMGKEDQAVKGPIAAAVRLKPDLALVAGEEFAPVFISEVEKVKKKALSEPLGALRVDTTPPGAGVWVDDREASTSPVLVKGLVPGTHYAKIKPPGGDPYVQRIEIKADDTARITPDASTRNEGAVAGLVSHLGRNELSNESKAKVKGIADKLGASFVVVGGAFAQGANMGIVSLLYSTKKDGFLELSRLTLDRDMLGATIEINKIAGEVGSKADTFGEPVKLPRPVAADAKAGDEKINEVSFLGGGAAAARTADAAAGGGAKPGGGSAAGDGGRKPVTGGRRPITGGGATRPEDAAPAPAPEASKPEPKKEKRPAVATKVDESGMVFKSNGGEDFKKEEPEDEPKDKDKFKYVGGSSIEEEKSFEDSGEEGGLLSKWWFWAGAAVVVGGGAAIGYTALDTEDPTSAVPTARW